MSEEGRARARDGHGEGRDRKEGRKDGWTG